jgi:hemoglobin
MKIANTLALVCALMLTSAHVNAQTPSPAIKTAPIERSLNPSPPTPLPKDEGSEQIKLASASSNKVHNESAIAGFGGYAGLMKINLDLVARLKANKLIGSLFQDTDAQRLAGLLSDQFCELLGGGCKYEGVDMKSSHQGMGIKTHHFNALAEELQRAMDAAGVSQAEQFRLIAKLAPMRRDLVD